MNSSSSETKTHKDETSEQRPLPEQMPYLQKAWSEASNQYDAVKANPYTGNFVAAPNQTQYDGYNALTKWANGTGINAAGNTLNTAQGQLASGTAGQQGALSGLMGFANTDQTQKNMATAAQYANSQDVNSIVKAGMFAANRNAAENIYPATARAAAAAGGINGDRKALVDAVTQRGLQEQAQNLGVTTQQNLYNQGLAMAQAQNNQQLQSLAGAGSLANTIAGQGYTGSSLGFDQTGKALTSAIAGGQGLQGLDQNVIDNGLKQYMNTAYMPWQNLQSYYGITGDLKGGTTHTVGDSTSETTQTPSMLSTIGSGIGILGSLFCSREVKNIIAGPVGKLGGKYNLYLYTYKGDIDPNPGRVHLSVIAEEVAEINPEAVHVINGILSVIPEKL